MKYSNEELASIREGMVGMVEPLLLEIKRYAATAVSTFQGLEETNVRGDYEDGQLFRTIKKLEHIKFAIDYAIETMKGYQQKQKED